MKTYNCFYCNKQLRLSVQVTSGCYYHCGDCNVQHLYDANNMELLKSMFHIDKYGIYINYKSNKSSISCDGVTVEIGNALKVTPTTPVSKIKTYLLFT